MWQCKNCGKQNSALYCTNCGAKSTEDIPPNAGVSTAETPQQKTGVHSWYKPAALSGCAALVIIAAAVSLMNHSAESIPPPSGSVRDTIAPNSAPAAIPEVEKELSLQESGEYPIGTYLELYAGKNQKIYYALGGEEIDEIPPEDYALYVEGDVLLPPYDSKLYAYCTNAFGVQGEVASRQYSVYDDDSAQQAYLENPQAVAALEPFLATKNRASMEPFATPEEISLESRQMLASYNTEDKKILDFSGTHAGANVLCGLDGMNKWLSVYFDGRAKPLTVEDNASDYEHIMSYEYYADMESTVPTGTSGKKDIKPEEKKGALLSETGAGTLVPTVLSYNEISDEKIELTLLIDYSGWYGTEVAGIENGINLGLVRNTGASHHVDRSFQSEGSDYPDENKIRRMNCGAYPAFYRCTLAPRTSDGGYMVESIRLLTPDYPAAFGAVVRASMPSGSTIAPEGFMRLTTDTSWLGDIYYSYDGYYFKKYPGLLVDIPQGDFSLYAYVKGESSDGEEKIGRTHKFDYSTCEIDPRVVEQLGIYYWLGNSSAVGDVIDDPLQSYDDTDFANTMYIAYLDQDSPKYAKPFEDTGEGGMGRFVSPEDLDAFTEQLTCGTKEINHEASSFFDPETSLYSSQMGVGAFYKLLFTYGEYCQTETGYTVKSQSLNLFGGYGGDNDGIERVEKECLELGMSEDVEISKKPYNAADDAGNNATSEADDRMKRAFWLKNYDEPYQGDDNTQWWGEYTFTNDPESGGIYLSGYKRLT